MLINALSQFPVRHPFLTFKGDDARVQPAHQGAISTECIHKDTFDTALKQLSKGIVNIHGKVSVSPETMAEMNRLLAAPTLDEPQQRTLADIVTQVMTKLLNKLISGKLTPKEEASLWFVDRKNLSADQASWMERIVIRFIDSHRTLPLNNPRKREAVLKRLMTLARPFGRESMVASIRDYQPFEVTNEVQHYTLKHREGPALNELKLSSYNMEHFHVVEYREPDPFAHLSGREKDLVNDLTENEKQVLASLSKMRRLAEVLTADPSDVVLLQEVRNIHVLRSMLKIYGLSEHYPNILYYPAQAGNDGLAILTTAQALPVEPRRVFTANAPRPSAEISLDLGNGQLVTVFNVHLKADKYKDDVMTVYHEPLRLKECSAIGKRVERLRRKHPDRLFIAAGDFNLDPDSGMAKFQRALGLKEVSTHHHPPTHKNGHLDRVFLSDNQEVTDIGVVGDLNASPPPPSDHLRLKLKVRAK